ncbi:dehydrogenase [Rhodococcus ruber BKS 20-38]|uniref:Dehydrogenase n=1 Tax=Rhodococcus ruber BKS 20-38 TaxID=1278076 RepID=M2ZW17_9NOCA|nr:SDR family oxidoreductase [Rhodococcus ruber]EME64953.1 dehydrogenase [Rhodococcus ruber BKS 20-38]
MQDFADRPGAALVAGGTGGIGRAVCRMLAERGSDVAFTFHRNDAAAADLETELRALGATVLALQVELSDSAAAAGVVDAAVATFGALHTLVHAAGPHVPMVHLSRVTPAQFRDQLVGDAGAFFNLVHAALPRLRESRGNIVAVTTAATRRFPVRDGLSAGPKGAVEALVRALAAEEGRFGVRVNAVGPGMLTDGTAARLIGSGDLDEHALSVARNNIPLRRFGDAHDVAEAVTFLASDRADFVSGQMLAVDGGYGA